MPYIKEGMKRVVDDGGYRGLTLVDWKYKDNIWAKTGTSQVTIGRDQAGSGKQWLVCDAGAV
jgi:cell division protein FtsI/penicillin-binding protein 2